MCVCVHACVCVYVCVWSVCIGLTLGEEGSGVCVNQEEEVRGREGLGSLRAGRTVGANSPSGHFQPRDLGQGGCKQAFVMRELGMAGFQLLGHVGGEVI